jgi:hypothetical protein
MLSRLRTLLKPTLLATLILLPACATGGGGSFCLTARPIYVGAQDQFSAETARAILAHNETGARLCGWLPREPARSGR